MTHVHEKILASIKSTDYFDGHVIEKQGPSTWFCHKKQGSISSFWISTQPGAVIMWGDMGEAIYCIYGGSSFHWGKRNFRFPDACSYYPFTKLSPQMRQERFNTADATAYLKQQIKEIKDDERFKSTRLDDLKRLIDAKRMLSKWEEAIGNEHYEDEGEWWRLWADFDMPDAPSMRTLSARTYWCYFCLCWFFTQVSADDERFKEAWNAVGT